jgi:hypothetical protein
VIQITSKVEEGELRCYHYEVVCYKHKMLYSSFMMTTKEKPVIYTIEEKLIKAYYYKNYHITHKKRKTENNKGIIPILYKLFWKMEYVLIHSMLSALP